MSTKQSSFEYRFEKLCNVFFFPEASRCVAFEFKKENSIHEEDEEEELEQIGQIQSQPVSNPIASNRCQQRQMIQREKKVTPIPKQVILK